MDKNTSKSYLAKELKRKYGTLIITSIRKAGGGHILVTPLSGVMYSINHRHKNPSGSLIMHFLPEEVNTIKEDGIRRNMTPAVGITLTVKPAGKEYLIIGIYTMKHLEQLAKDSLTYHIDYGASGNLLIRYQEPDMWNQFINSADILGVIIPIL